MNGKLFDNLLYCVTQIFFIFYHPTSLQVQDKKNQKSMMCKNESEFSKNNFIIIFFHNLLMKI